MIIQPDITKSTQAAIALVRRMPQQVRYAASTAVNNALRVGYQAVQSRMGQVFDRPTPYTLRGGIGVKPSTKDRLVGELALATEGTSANVPAGKPLLAEVQGGSRRLKRSELLLQRAGVLPAGYLTVPGRGARLDAYGNISRGQILEILAWFKTFGALPQGSTRRNAWRDNLGDKGRARKMLGTRNRAGFEYFAVRPGDKGGLSPGIYRRQLAGRFVGPVGQRPVAVLVFVRRAVYQRRLDFVQQAERAIQASLPQALTAALRRALETAR